MVSLLARLLVLIAAGYALYRLWRTTSSDDYRIRLTILIGFLARAILSQGLFWISWLSLPLAKSMQLGRGLWFFANDALVYTARAGSAADQGLSGVAAIPITFPSVTYTQTLSLFSFAFGNVVAVSMLLNLFCYLGTCAVIVWWSNRVPDSRNAALVAIAAISLSPAGMLWSLQPLKDTFIQFLIVAFAATCFLWQRMWRAGGDGRKATMAAIGMIATLYLASGVRWYIGLMLLTIATLFVIFVALTSRERRRSAIVASFFLLFFLTRAFAAVSHPYLPLPLRKSFSFQMTALRDVPASVGDFVERARSGFERTGGNTSIRPGSGIVPQPAHPPRVQIAENRTPSPAIVSPETPAPRPVETTTTKPPQATTTAPPTTVSPTTPRVVPAPVPARREPVNIVPDVAIEPPNETRFAKFITGAVAAIVPRAIATRLKLVEIGGAPQLWWFVELDTLVFDAVMLAAIVAIVVNRRRGTLSNSIFWLVVGMTILMTVLLVYTVTNFGTLFRLRAMIYTCLALIPLAIMTAPRRPAAGTPAPVPVQPASGILPARVDSEA
jgi:hypothetical protein